MLWYFEHTCNNMISITIRYNGGRKTRINLIDYIKIRSNVTNVGKKGDDVNMRSDWGLTCFVGIK